MSRLKLKIISSLLTASLLIISCSPTVNDEPFSENAEENSNQLPVSGSLESATETATQEPTAIPQTPTPDLRILPSAWQEWPIVPEVTNRAREIFQIGKEKGVNQNTFSKVGDCHNISDAFLGIYDKPGRYFLRPDEQVWQATIDNFKGYFGRDGASFGQGLNVAAALSPFHANPELCQPTEGPLQCELRIVNPSFAFVSFERWWSKETPPEVYEQYLRRIIDILIENGTVPILITKADNIEGGHLINHIIANMAFEYDIPLMNWWRAAQFLDNNGMDPERNDGFHISYQAWDTRSYYALETLDKLWKELEQNNE